MPQKIRWFSEHVWERGNSENLWEGRAGQGSLGRRGSGSPGSRGLVFISKAATDPQGGREQ